MGQIDKQPQTKLLWEDTEDWITCQIFWYWKDRICYVVDVLNCRTEKVTQHLEPQKKAEWLDEYPERKWRPINDEKAEYWYKKWYEEWKDPVILNRVISEPQQEDKKIGKIENPFPDWEICRTKINELIDYLNERD